MSLKETSECPSQMASLLTGVFPGILKFDDHLIILYLSLSVKVLILNILFCRRISKYSVSLKLFKQECII